MKKLRGGNVIELDTFECITTLLRIEDDWLEILIMLKAIDNMAWREYCKAVPPPKQIATDFIMPRALHKCSVIIRLILKLNVLIKCAVKPSNLDASLNSTIQGTPKFMEHMSENWSPIHIKKLLFSTIFYMTPA